MRKYLLLLMSLLCLISNGTFPGKVARDMRTKEQIEFNIEKQPTQNKNSLRRSS